MTRPTTAAVGWLAHQNARDLADHVVTEVLSDPDIAAAADRLTRNDPELSVLLDDLLLGAATVAHRHIVVGITEVLTLERAVENSRRRWWRR